MAPEKKITNKPSLKIRAAKFELGAPMAAPRTSSLSRLNHETELPFFGRLSPEIGELDA